MRDFLTVPSRFVAYLALIHFVIDRHLLLLGDIKSFTFIDISPSLGSALYLMSVYVCSIVCLFCHFPYVCLIFDLFGTFQT